MATYGHRSSQRLRRDAPAIASSSRNPTSSSTSSTRRTNAEASSSSASQLSREANSYNFDEGDNVMLQCRMLNVTDTARKQVEQVGQAEIDKRGAQLARYALACEYKRIPIRKDDVRKEVLDEGTSRCFIPVFNAAQKMLHQTFGLIMSEVRARGADNAELTKQAQEVLRAAASSANGLRPRGQQREDSSNADGGPGTNMWILRSALPNHAIQALVTADEELTRIYTQASTTNASNSSNQRRRQSAKETKAAIDWKSADHQDGEMGLLYIILALILVNGRTITEATLYMYLRRLHLDPRTLLPSALRGTGPAFSSASTGSQSTQTQARTRAMPGTLEGFLNAMTKQSYLEKQRSDVGVDVMDAAVNQAQTQSRRWGRTSGAGGGASGAADEDTVWEWRWGSRAEAEIGEKRIAELISLIFTDPSATQDGAQAAEGDEDDETQAIDRDRRAKRRKMLLTNIASVAGSQLVGQDFAFSGSS
ncbi:uncharacterized protein UTRI_03789_B [Ustilago trichophora]|uniref:MAGE domain-containing protein n=1 Tax=Ustilago trichophora TaxID=86804 RepID=A0A5C3DZ17_9BASI|nr:uncharacterized protein UTRI_03789_B [Ustilago trichophora]